MGQSFPRMEGPKRKGDGAVAVPLWYRRATRRPRPEATGLGEALAGYFTQTSSISMA